MDAKECSACGASCLPGAVQCFKCGAAFAGAAVDRSPSADPSTARRWRGYALLLGVMILGYCGVYYAAKGSLHGFPWPVAIGQALAVVVAVAIGRQMMQGHRRGSGNAL